MKFKEIREHYKKVLPKMMAIYRQTGQMQFDPYDLDFTQGMTPIEESVWYDIRILNISMYPQIPALQYFLDFANPFIKVAIECDGKQWHDPEKDAIRDSNLIADGWTIYRIPGSKCNRVLKDPMEIFNELRSDGFSEQDAEEEVRPHAKKWFLDTSTGIVKAIGVRHFGQKSRFDDLVEWTISEHQSHWFDSECT